VLGELPDRRAFAAGDDEGIDVVELLGATNVDGFGPESLEGLDVLAEVALEAEDSGAS
jgi:hypothetical protein